MKTTIMYLEHFQFYVLVEVLRNKRKDKIIKAWEKTQERKNKNPKNSTL